MGATGGVVGAATGGGVGSKTGGIVPKTGGNVVTASVTAGVGLEVSISMAGKDIEMDSASASRTTFETNVTAVDSTGAMVGMTSMTGLSPSSPVKSIEPDRSTMEMQDNMMPSETTGNCSRLPLPPSPDFRGCRSLTAPPAGALLCITKLAKILRDKSVPLSLEYIFIINILMAILVTTLCERADDHGGRHRPTAAVWPLYLVEVDQMVAKGVRAMYHASTR